MVTTKKATRVTSRKFFIHSVPNLLILNLRTFDDEHKQDIGQFGTLNVVADNTIAIGGTVTKGMIDMNIMCI